MNDITILIISYSLGTLMVLATIIYIKISDRRFFKEGSEKLQQHLISMDLYNRQANKRSEEANRRQEKWFRELGYNDRRILEILDEPEID